MKNIILYGFMGTGKTTVGRMLATKSGSAFIDTDAEIVKRQGMSIPDIFATRGEEYFRQCEAELVQELAGKRGTIISTGGGTMRNPANVAALHGSGIVVYLVADVDQVLNLGAVLIGEVLYRYVTGMLRPEIDRHFGGCDRSNDTLDRLPVIYGFDGILQQLLKALFGFHGGSLFHSCSLVDLHGLIDLVAHLLFYLLNDPSRN